MSIIPTPQEWHWQKGLFKVSDHTSCFCSPAGAETDRFLRLIHTKSGCRLTANGLQEWPDHPQGCYLVLLDSSKAADWLAGRGLALAPEHRQEGYLLLVETERLVLAAYTETGLFYGMQSLDFLWRKQGVAAVTIRDWPAMAWRGVSDDISRGQISTPAHFERIIKTLASFKINRYLLYMEDVLECRAYPGLTQRGGGLSARDVKVLQDLAEQNHMELIPIFQTLGHYENILQQDEFQALADYPGAASLNVTNPQTYLFLKNCLDELTTVFCSPYVHIGGDESFDVGRGASRRLTAEVGPARVHADHYNKVIDLLRPAGKTVLMYGDMIQRYPDALAALPRDVILVDWDYDAKKKFPSIDLFAGAQRPFLVSPGIHNWRKLFPDFKSAATNIEHFTLQGRARDALGAVVSSWNDFGAVDLREINTYGYAFAAECAWKPERKNRDWFDKRFFDFVYGSRHPQVAQVYAELQEMSRQVSWMQWISQPFYPVDKKRRKEIARAARLAERSDRVQTMLASLEERVTRNRDHLDIMEWCNRCYGWYGRLAQAQLALLQSDAEAATQLNSLAAQLQGIISEYRVLWKRYNRPENLNLVTDLMERQVLALQNKADQVRAGEFAFDGNIPSPFITCSAAAADGDSVVLQRRFDAGKTPRFASLQLIADSHAELFVNGQRIGQVLARRSASAFVQAQRVKVWDVVPYLVAGANTIRVVVRNYVPGAVAAANVWMEWDGGILHSGDGLWQAGNGRSGWSPAIPVLNTWTISRPMLQKGVTSRIEFF